MRGWGRKTTYIKLVPILWNQSVPPGLSLHSISVINNMTGPMNGTSISTAASSVSPAELAAMLRKSADVVERKEFHPVLYQTMRQLTAYAGEYAEGMVSASSEASAVVGAAAPTSAGDRGDASGKKISPFHDVPESVLDTSSNEGYKSGAASGQRPPSAGGAMAAAERVGAPPGGIFSSAAVAAGASSSAGYKTKMHSPFILKGIKKGIDKIAAFDNNKFVGEKGSRRDEVPFDEYQKNSSSNTNNGASDGDKLGVTPPTASTQQQQHHHHQQQQQPSSASNDLPSNLVIDPNKPARPCFQRPINPSSNLIANGWINQQRRSKMRVVWKDVLASLVEGRRPGEETTLWIQRQVIDAATGKVTGLEALHQIPMKWLEDVNYVDLYGDYQFTLKVYNIAEEFFFRTLDEQSAQSWVLTLRSARDSSLEGNVRMVGVGPHSGGSVATEKRPTAKDMGLHDLEDWDSKEKQQSQGEEMLSAGGRGGGINPPQASSAAAAAAATAAATATTATTATTAATAATATTATTSKSNSGKDVYFRIASNRPWCWF